MIVTLLLLISITDALRDRWIYRRSEVGWWRWHLVKWFSFFGLCAGWVYGFDYEARALLWLILVCWLVWNTVYWWGRLEFKLTEVSHSNAPDLIFRLELTLKDRM